jgi:hypothetical protein
VVRAVQAPKIRLQNPRYRKARAVRSGILCWILPVATAECRRRSCEPLEGAILKSWFVGYYTPLSMNSRSTLKEGYPNGKEAVLKTAGRKPLQVRILSPPPSELTSRLR